MEVIGVFRGLETHDLICPDCNSCVTKRIILREKERTFQSRRNDANPYIPETPIALEIDIVSKDSKDKQILGEIDYCLDERQPPASDEYEPNKFEGVDLTNYDREPSYPRPGKRSERLLFFRLVSRFCCFDSRAKKRREKERERRRERRNDARSKNANPKTKTLNHRTSSSSLKLKTKSPPTNPKSPVANEP